MAGPLIKVAVPIAKNVLALLGLTAAMSAIDGSILQLKKALISPPLLTNSEIQKYYQNEPRFNGVYSRDNLPKKIKKSICNTFR